MRRNRELQINLLRQVRDGVADPVVQNTPENEIIYNAALLIDEGLVDGKKAKDHQGQCTGVRISNLTPAGHDFLEAIDQAPQSTTPNQPVIQSMTIFISHSSQDADLAGKLANLFQLSFTLSPEEILCTSVDGYKLEVGVDTDQRLRREVKESKLFLALITPTSIRSSYVLFELGGRWCTELPMFLVMGRGANSSSLEGPLRGINALNLKHRPDVQQLLDNMATALNRRLAPMSSIDASIEIVCDAATSVEIDTQNQTPDQVTANLSLDEIDEKILHYIYEIHPEQPEISELVEKLGIRLREVGYSTRKLIKYGLISNPPSIKSFWLKGKPNPNGFGIRDRGIDYIKQNRHKFEPDCF